MDHRYEHAKPSLIRRDTPPAVVGGLRADAQDAKVAAEHNPDSGSTTTDSHSWNIINTGIARADFYNINHSTD